VGPTSATAVHPPHRLDRPIASPRRRLGAADFPKRLFSRRRPLQMPAWLPIPNGSPRLALAAPQLNDGLKRISTHFHGRRGALDKMPAAGQTVSFPLFSRGQRLLSQREWQRSELTAAAKAQDTSKGRYDLHNQRPSAGIAPIPARKIAFRGLGLNVASPRTQTREEELNLRRWGRIAGTGRHNLRGPRLYRLAGAQARPLHQTTDGRADAPTDLTQLLAYHHG
jgi:hypothetical protein